MSDKFVTQYSFSHQSCYDAESVSFPIQTSNQKTILVSDASTWRTPLREFTNFLSGVYGYDITSQVFVEDIDIDGDAAYVTLSDSDV